MSDRTSRDDSMLEDSIGIIVAVSVCLLMSALLFL